MKRAALILAALAVAFAAAPAAPVRTATENFVSNKIAEAIAAFAASGDYEIVSNAAMNARAKADLTVYMPAPWILSSSTMNGRMNWDDTRKVWVGDGKSIYTPSEAVLYFSNGTWIYEYFVSYYYCQAPEDSLSINLNNFPYAFTRSSAFPVATGDTLVRFSDIPAVPTVPDWALQPNKPTYTASEVGATTPEDVTATIREQSLGGIWDEELQVWWTPRMRNGSMTYEATTNVNLNAEN